VDVSQDVLDQGAAIRRRAQGAKSDSMQTIAADLDAEMPDFVDGFVFGTIWTRPGLSFEERMLVAISALAAQGKGDQLRNYLFGALYEGMSARKVQETLVMMFVYGGFPNASSMLLLWRETIERARRQGLKVDLDPEEQA
jgi:4-carboxymuconolactone decarboxylase